jgi:hypothetical protein
VGCRVFYGWKGLNPTNPQPINADERRAGNRIKVLYHTKQYNNFLDFVNPPSHFKIKYQKSKSKMTFKNVKIKRVSYYS